ncbi:TIGR01777 family oxidoreductase [Urechidicola vernalis]|uniref:TIGR01777 family oxidoreductase n=1 Tax=Urechidicola vernalis TaxID=3075600 RepID=A0ABU2Y3W2_9FLAO|nr:TIGR01777 family oxidoreductase [Urechidicola sp. P050]MDT0552392.1 TIGR01777 family oxidoreductase [Urechidicola sp. P050]
MERVLITGIGLVGVELATLLTEKGYKVSFLSRSIRPHFKFKTYKWDIENRFIELDALKSCDYIVHLAGSNISEGRWTKKRKIELRNSRVLSTKLLFNTIKENNIVLKGYIGASAIGYYGACTNEFIYSEDMPASNDFIGSLCNEWETAHLKFNEFKIPLNIIRIGVVLSNKGGAFIKILKPIKSNLGAVIGNGNQYMPWIHIHDLCKIILVLLNSKNSKIYNAVATEHITNKELTNKIYKFLNKKLLLPKIPKFVMKLLFGEMSVILLEGSRISNKKIKSNLNFKFKFDSTSKALNELL